MKSTLTPSAQSIIDSYRHMSLNGHDIVCPYFNNKKNTQRGALRVNIGKGTAEEIIEEAEILAQREHIKLSDLSPDDIKKFLVEKNLGIDCSAFAYYILNAECKEKYNKELKQILHFPHAKNPLRKLLTKLRPVENTSVRVLADEKNSTEIPLSDIQPGDMIIMMNGGPRKDYNHVLIVTEVKQSPLEGGAHEVAGGVNADKKENSTSTKIKSSSHFPLPTSLNYTHSFVWPSDGQYNHGIKHGEITITDITKPLLDQQWTENEKTGEENWTYMHGKSCERVFVARLHE